MEFRRLAVYKPVFQNLALFRSQPCAASHPSGGLDCDYRYMLRIDNKPAPCSKNSAIVTLRVKNRP